MSFNYCDKNKKELLKIEEELRYERKKLEEYAERIREIQLKIKLRETKINHLEGRKTQLLPKVQKINVTW